jgi:uncharacterized protein (DUF779 family)
MICLDFIPNSEPDSYPRLGVLIGERILEVGESNKGTLAGWLARGKPKLDDLRQTIIDVQNGKIAMLNGHERRVFALADVILVGERRDDIE